jgi:hypothetical protein
MNWILQIAGGIIGCTIGTLIVGAFWWRDWRRLKKKYSQEIDALNANYCAQFDAMNEEFVRQTRKRYGLD